MTYCNGAVKDTKYNNTDTSIYNCRNSNVCPLQNNRLASSLVYINISTFENARTSNICIGSIKHSYTTRWYQHVLSNKNSSYKISA